MGSSLEFTMCECCGSALMVCGNCGKSFPRRVHEDETSWGSRRYCGTACAAAARKLAADERAAARLAEKPCAREGCEGVCKQRRNESPASFEERKFCSFECSCLSRRQSDPQKLERRRQQRLVRKGLLDEVTVPLPKKKPTPKPAESNLSEKTQKALAEAIAAKPAPAQEAPRWRPAAWLEMEKAGRR